MKIKFNFGLWDCVQFLLNCAIAMQVGAIAGKLVISMLKDTGAPPLVVVLTALLAIFGSVIITGKALFAFDKWIDKWIDNWFDSKKGRKYRIKILNTTRAWSIWLVDKSTEGGIYKSELDGHGVIGIGFFRIKHGESLYQINRQKNFTAYRFWRFSVEFGKR